MLQEWVFTVIGNSICPLTLLKNVKITAVNFLVFDNLHLR